MTFLRSHRLYRYRYHIAMGILSVALLHGSTRSVLRGQVSPSGASLDILPASQTAFLDQSVTVDVKVTATSEAVAGIDAIVTFPPILAFQSGSGVGSVFETEVLAPAASGSRIRFSQVRIIGGGYTGTQGQIVRLNFRAIQLGTGMIQVDEANSEVLRYSDGTDVLSAVSSATVQVSAAASSSSSSATVSSSAVSSSVVSSVASSVPASSSAPSSNAQSSAVQSPEQSNAPSPSLPSPSTGNSGGAPSGNQGRGATNGGAASSVARSSRSAASVATHAAALSLCDDLDSIAAYRAKPAPLRVIIDAANIDLRDVSGDSWFAAYVSYLVRQEIVSGYRDGKGMPLGLFGPGNTVTHAEITKMILESADEAFDVRTITTMPRNTFARNQWFQGYVRAAEDRGWSLYASGTLRPVAQATRGDVAKHIVDGFGFAARSSPVRFSDLPANHRYADAIGTLAALEVVGGDTDAAGNPTGTVRPNDPVNRAEAAKMITRAIRVHCGK